MNMRKYYLFYLLSTFLLFTACDEAMKDNLPAEYATVLHFKLQDGKNEAQVKLLHTGDVSIYSFKVGKSGNNPSAKAEGIIKAYTEQELETYNSEYNTSYELLSASYYNLSSTNVSFSEEENMKQVDVSFDTNKIAEQLDETKQYVLPLRIESSSSSIDKNSGMLLLQIEVKTPTVTLANAPFTTYERNKLDVDKTLTVPLTLYVDLTDNKWNFDVEFVAHEGLQPYVTAYNAQQAGINYTLLPQANVTQMPESISFKNGQLLVVGELSIDYTGLNGGDYLLPLVLDKCVGQPFDVDPKPVFIHLFISEELPRISITADMLVDSAPSEPGGPPNNWDVAHPWSYLLDDNFNTYSMPEWTVNTGAGNQRKPHHPKFGLWIDIELEKPLTVFSFDYRTANSNLQVPTEIEIYVYNSTDELDALTPIAILKKTEDKLPTNKDLWYKSRPYTTLGDTSFKRIRIAVIRNGENKDLREKVNGSMALSELKIYGMEVVD